MITCPKCEGVQMDWETDSNSQLKLSTYVCPLCNLNVSVNWKNNGKREEGSKEGGKEG